MPNGSATPNVAVGTAHVHGRIGVIAALIVDSLASTN